MYVGAAIHSSHPPWRKPQSWDVFNRMQNEIVISVSDVSKKFRLFASSRERFIEALHPLRKRYHREFWALQGVSFGVARGEIVGVLGRNGSGKSTLLQIICSVMQPTSGSISVNGKVSALLELGAGFNPEFTGRENVILNGAIMGFSRDEMLEKMPLIEAFAEIGEHFDQPVKTYSSGMFVRVAFAAAVHVEPQILIVDEALSVGDAKFQHRCFQRIREFMDRGKTILFVSHSVDTVLRLCTRGLVMEGGRLCYDGPVVEAVNLYQNLLFGTHHEERDDAEQPLTQSRQARLLGSGRSDVVNERLLYNAHETRLGSGQVQIIDIEIMADGRYDPPRITANQPVELLVKLLFQERVEGVSVGFAVVSLDGTYVFGTNLHMQGAPLLTAEAGECVVVRFDWKACLVGGDYFLNVGCSQIDAQSDRFLDVRRSVMRLCIKGAPGIVGLVDMQVEHEVLASPGEQAASP